MVYLLLHSVDSRTKIITGVVGGGGFVSEGTGATYRCTL